MAKEVRVRLSSEQYDYLLSHKEENAIQSDSGTMRYILDKVAALEEENEQLKKENESLRTDIIDLTHKMCDISIKVCNHLDRYNPQTNQPSVEITLRPEPITNMNDEMFDGISDAVLL